MGKGPGDGLGGGRRELSEIGDPEGDWRRMWAQEKCRWGLGALVQSRVGTRQGASERICGAVAKHSGLRGPQEHQELPP